MPSTTWEVGLPIFFLTFFTVYVTAFDWESLHLPVDHIPYFLRNNPDIRQLCELEDLCPLKESLPIKKCWGYESGCPLDERLSNPTCPGDSRGWTETEEAQWQMFWEGGDFGYVQQRRNEMTVMCAPKVEGDSLLECAKYTRYCRAKNIYIDFRHHDFKASKDRFQEDIFREGEIGGHCQMNRKALQKEGEHKSPLQSWFAELEQFSALPFHPIDDHHCDIIIDKPTMFVKLDAGVNLFHHFCDFINLYTSQHINNSFTTDVNIIMWDTSGMPYSDIFNDTWRAFTDHPIMRISDFQGKRVCVQDVVFPLLPRMRWGMFYNMPLIHGCYGSSLFQAFSRHLTYRLNVPQHGPSQSKVRVTLLSRSTKFRNIMNEDELIDALKTSGEYEVHRVAYQYREFPFLDQVERSHNSDIFIGMHGAGLTHMLFQPDWGAIIELYSCEDPNCYLDLARLRGVKYFTWEKTEKLVQEDGGHHPTLGDHAKFTNYAFDVTEFMRLVGKAADHVRSHPAFIAARDALQTTDAAKEEL